MLLVPGTTVDRGTANLPNVKLSCYNRLSYGLRVQSIDQVFVLKMQIIVVIPIKFQVKNRQFV